MIKLDRYRYQIEKQDFIDFLEKENATDVIDIACPYS